MRLASSERFSKSSVPFVRLLLANLWLLISMLVACSDDAAESVGTKETAAALADAQEYTLELALPKSVGPNGVVLGASESMKIEDGVEVRGNTDTAPAHVLNTGRGLLEIGADAKIGAPNVVISAQTHGNAFLRERASVSGNLTLGGTLETQNKWSVGGEVLQSQDLFASEKYRIAVSFPSASTSINLEPDQAASPTPGALGNVTLKPRADLKLSRGSYFLESLDAHSESKITLGGGGGPVILFIRGNFSFRGRVQGQDVAKRLLIVGLESKEWSVDSPIQGTIFHPKGGLRLSPVDGAGHDGAFIAKTLEAGARNPIRFAPFGFWDEVFDTQEQPSAISSLELLLPRGVSLANVALGAKEGFTVGPRAVLSAAGQVLTSASGNLDVQTGARVPGLVTGDGARVGASAVVSGDIRSEAASVVAPEASVSGTVTPGQQLSPPDALTLNVVIPSPADGDLLVRSARSRALIPGNYGSVRVEAGGTLHVRAGHYTVQSLVLETGSTLVVESGEGLVRMDIGSALEANGTVRAAGTLPSTELALITTSNGTVEIGGVFKGSIIAPDAVLTISGGEHAGFFYGGKVVVSADAQVTAGSGRRWLELFPDPNWAGTRVESGERGGSLRASSNSPPATYSNPAGFDLRIRSRLVVEAGNAGNGTATLSYSSEGTTQSCLYRGQASTSHPTTLQEIARGMEYVFQSCTDGSEPGSVVRVTSVDLSLTGDDQDPGGVTRVALAVDTSCNQPLPSAISPARSRELIESFVWPVFQGLAVPDPAQGLPARIEPRVVAGRVQESSSVGGAAPALYYAQIYIRNKKERDFLDQFMIHWSSRPLFADEWPKDWEDACGTIKHNADGEGMWVYAVLPGVTYNAIREARSSDKIAEKQRETFSAIRLLSVPTAMATEVGSINLRLLGQTGFRYLGLNELPSDEAIDAMLYRAGVVAELVDIVEFVVDAVRDVVREAVIFLGTIDSIYGTVRVGIDVNVKKADNRFVQRDTAGRVVPMYSAWQPGRTAEIAPEGIRVSMYNTVQRITSLGMPVPVKFAGVLDAAGRVTLDVSRDDDVGGVAFDSICYELQNDAGLVTSFLIADEVCDGTKGGRNFERFQKNSNTEISYDNRDFTMHAELTDSYKYLQQVVGVKPKPAKLLTGKAAWHLSAFQDKAWTPCFGYGNGVVDTAVAGVANIGIAFPPAAPLAAFAAAYLAALADADIIITEEHETHASRGVIGHEYGHYALCSLVREPSDVNASEDFLSSAVLTFDTIENGDDLQLDDEARLINEAFADFYAGQVANGTNYFSVGGQEEGYVNIAVGPPAMDANISTDNVNAGSPAGQARGRREIGRLATLLQDVYDGHRGRTGLPNDGDFWVPVPGRPAGATVDVITRNTGSRYGDTDAEDVSLGGADILRFVQQFSGARNLVGSYRTDAFEKGIAATLKESVSWCRACRVMAPHFKNLSAANTRAIMETCVTEADLTAALGSPPGGDFSRLDAFSCAECPPGQGMGSSGTCSPCSTDVTIDWSLDAKDCRRETVQSQTVGGDLCPSTLVVEVVNASGTYPLQSVGQSPSGDTSGLGSCVNSQVLGSVEATKNGATTTRTVNERGVPQCLDRFNPLPPIPSGEDEIGCQDDELCFWAGANKVLTSIDAQRVRVVTEAKPGSAIVNLYGACTPPEVR